MEGFSLLAHKQKGALSSYKFCKKSFQKGRDCVPHSGQQVCLLLSGKGGKMIYSTSSFNLSSNGLCKTMLLIKFIGFPQLNVWQTPGHKTGRLFFKYPPLQLHSTFFHPLHNSTNRSFCLPRQYKASPILLVVGHMGKQKQ